MGSGPLPGRVFRGGCSWVEHRLVGRCCCVRASTAAVVPGSRVGVLVGGGVEGVVGGGVGLTHCWVLRERARGCLLSRLVGSLVR